MKKACFIMVSFIMIIILLSSCDPTVNDPMHAELRLVPLTTGDLAKAVMKEDGRQYMPISELPVILQKAASADIDFGNMAATKTLQYVLMNVGNTDVYDITFVTNDLKTHPAHIPLVPTPDEGGDLIALPIVSITKEHVIPPSGVGSYLEFETGSFNDVMTLCYNYELTHTETDSVYDGDELIVTDTVIVDSFDIADEYTVGGVKAGAFIGIETNGVDICEATFTTPSLYDGSLAGTVLWTNLHTADLTSVLIRNNGNVSLRMRVINPYEYVNGSGTTVIDTVIQPDMSIDLSGKVRGELYFSDTYDQTRGNVIILGAEINQPYIFEVMGHVCIDGEFRILINEEQ